VWPGEGIVQIDVPLTAPLGLTPVTATLTDAVSGVTHTTVFDVNVTACQPVACSAGQCGTIAASDGCGGDTPVTCSSCPSGEVCSDNHCCPSGYGWSPSDDECVVVCPTGKEWCAVTGTCLAPAICQERTNGSGGCRKVGNLVECM
jgi:hypothetical protein